jgi:geranylgeranylglycerol-phosphate geranylgeranyltransferase
MVGAVVLYGAAAVGSLMTPMALYAAGVAFFANLGREIIKDCEDMESDEGRRTFPMKVGLMNARATAYVFILLAIVVLYLPHWLGPLTMNQLLFQAPAIFLLMSLNGPLFKGEDYIAQQRVRMGMLLGLLALVVEVSV